MPLEIPDPNDGLVAAAKAVAEQAHAGQTDKVGKPYITHPARVAARVNDTTDDPNVVASAWLHDVTEDTDVTGAQLADLGFPTAVIDAVDALHHRDNEDEDTYLRRIAADPVATQVKMADMADNSAPDRLAELADTDPATAARLSKKYARRTESLRRLASEQHG